MADKAGKNTLNFYKNSPDFSHGVGKQNKRPMTLHGRYRYVPFGVLWGQRRSSVAGLTEDDRQTVDKERQVGDPMQLRTEVLNL